MATKTMASAAPAATVSAVDPSIAGTSAAPAATQTTFDDVLAHMSAVAALSVAGKEYVSKLTDFLNDKSRGAITVEMIPNRVQGIACVKPGVKQAVILAFSESDVSSKLDYPLGDHFAELYQTFKTIHDDVSVLEYIAVTPDSYPRVENMATTVVNIFLAVEPGNALTAAMFNNMKLVPSTDVNQVRSFIDKYSPHAVQDRADWGVLVSRVVHNTRIATYQNVREPEPQPILAVAGYTKFVQVQANGLVKYLPICIVTNVTSTIPSVDILNLALPIVAGCIIAQRAWERPYTKFTKGSPNLGRLRYAADGKNLDWFSTLDQMHSELPKMLVDVPLMAIDCAEGRAHIPGLEAFVINGDAAVLGNASKFFGAQIVTEFSQMRQNAIAARLFNYEGEYKADGQVMDTRNGDYINMVTSTGDFGRCQRALNQSTMPQQHIVDIASIYGEDAVKSLYRVHTIVFNSHLINILAQYIASIVNYTAESCVNQNIDMGALLQAFNTRIGGSNAIYGGVYTQMTPGSIYY